MQDSHDREQRRDEKEQLRTTIKLKEIVTALYDKKKSIATVVHKLTIIQVKCKLNPDPLYYVSYQGKDSSLTIIHNHLTEIAY